MPTPTEQLLSRTVYATDGSTTVWDFSFASGYLDPSHVKAYTTDVNGSRTDIIVTAPMLIGEFQLQITPALPVDLTLTIYRDTPKDTPLVDFMDESGFSEISLDTNAKQAVFIAAEAVDVVNSSDIQGAIEAAEAAAGAAATATAGAATATAAAAQTAVDAATATDAAADAAASAASIAGGPVASWVGLTDVVTQTEAKTALAYTASDVGLANVDNTSDANKPVSTAQAAAIAARAGAGANNDITSLSALSTAITIAQGGTGATTANAARTNLLQLPPVRQTVLNGPVDTSGLSAFGGSTGSTTVTATGTITPTAANGVAGDYIGSITNPSWTSLSTNGTMYLYLDIAAAGTCTTGSTTLAPTYRWGGADVVTSNQFTFNIQEMVGKVGNGSVATQTYRVFVGEVTVSGSVVTAITWYALQGRYQQAWVSTLPAAGVAVSANHNIGTVDLTAKLEVQNITTEFGFVAGDTVTEVNGNTGGFAAPISIYRTAKTVGFTNANTGPMLVLNKTTGANAVMTLANWKYRLIAQRSW